MTELTFTGQRVRNNRAAGLKPPCEHGPEDYDTNAYGTLRCRRCGATYPMSQTDCPDCGVVVGAIHIDVCDMPRCSTTGVQRMQCRDGHECPPATWCGPEAD